MRDDDFNSAQFLDRVRAGDEAAFRALYDHFYDPLWGFALRTIGIRDAADDVVQEAFVSLYHRRKQLTLSSTLRSYLYGSVHRLALMHLRRDSMVERVHSKHSYETESFGISEAPDPALTGVIETDRKSALVFAVANLPERQKLAFGMRWDGLSVAEIAEAMDVSVVAVRKLLEKAVLTITKAVRDY